MKRGAWVGAALLALIGLAVASSGRAKFIIGGALVNMGFRMQDHLEPYDPRGGLRLSASEIFERLLVQNELASKVRSQFPRSVRHPLVAMLVCMDARLDTNELVGDTRKYYYVIRTAGSVLSPMEEDMLELAVENGVRAIVLTTHSECAAEKAAHEPSARARYPYLAQAIDERSRRRQELLERPAIATRIAKGELVVRQVHIDTATARMSPSAVGASAP